MFSTREVLNISVLDTKYIGIRNRERIKYSAAISVFSSETKLVNVVCSNVTYSGNKRTFVDIVEEEFGKENQNGRIIIFDIKYEFHSEVGHNQKQ